MSNAALVPVRVTSGRTEVLQRYSPGSVSTYESRGAEIRRTPSLFGLGFIESANALTIDGRTRSIFGALAEESSLKVVVARAFAVELGVSSHVRCARREIDLPYPVVCEPVVSDKQLEDVVAFVRYLAAPPKRGTSDLRRGKQLFGRARCDECHRASISTREDTFLPLRSKTVEAYTDLLVHDLGEGVRVRTAALWGLNSTGPPYMHHAGAKTIEVALELHGGEATESRERYRSFSEIDRADLVRFLKEL